MNKMKHTVPLLAILLAVLLLSGCEQKTETLASFTIIADDSRNVFAQTIAAHKVEYDSVEAGVFVKAIEGVSQSKRAYWLYTVNSAPGNIACERFPVAPGDTIVWKLTSLY